MQPTDSTSLDRARDARHPAGRQAAIVAYVEETTAATVAELSARFGVSADTVRRDLDRLDADGVLSRTHGGAIIRAEDVRRDTAFDVRMRTDEGVKERIGQLAASLVKDDTAIVVGSGTTALAFARHLGERRNLTVMTNHLLLPDAIPENAVRDLYLLGGLIRSGARATVGPVVFGAGTDLGRRVRCDLAVVGVGGIDTAMGISTSHVGEAQMMAEMMRLSNRVAILADSTKFDHALFAQIVPLSKIDYLVTDAQPPQALTDALQREGVHIMVAPHTLKQ